MKTNYTNYKAEQLLEDDFFINSILHPTEETELFWDCLLYTSDAADE